MGALPSRETHERGLYSHRHGRNRRNEIILIPLTTAFFPSADCPLFQHLYNSRYRRTPKYYFRALRSAQTPRESDYFCTTAAINEEEVFDSFYREYLEKRELAEGKTNVAAVPATTVSPTASSPLLSGVSIASSSGIDTEHANVLANAIASRQSSQDSLNAQGRPPRADPMDFRSYSDTREGLYQVLIRDNEPSVFATDEALRQAYWKQLQEQQTERQRTYQQKRRRAPFQATAGGAGTGGPVQPPPPSTPLSPPAGAHDAYPPQGRPNAPGTPPAASAAMLPMEDLPFDEFVAGYVAAKRYMKGKPLHTHYSTAAASDAKGDPVKPAEGAAGSGKVPNEYSASHYKHVTSPAAYAVRPLPCVIASRYDPGKPQPVDDPLYVQFGDSYLRIMGMFGLFPSTVGMRRGAGCGDAADGTGGAKPQRSFPRKEGNSNGDDTDEESEVEQHLLKGTMFVDKDVGDQILGNMVMLATYMYVRQCIEARIHPQAIPMLPVLMRFPLSNIPMLQFVREFRVRLRSLLEAGTAKAGQKPVHTGMSGFNPEDLAEPHHPLLQRLEEEGYLFEPDIPSATTPLQLFMSAEQANSTSAPLRRHTGMKTPNCGKYPIIMMSGFNVQSTPLRHPALNTTGYPPAMAAAATVTAAHRHPAVPSPPWSSISAPPYTTSGAAGGVGRVSTFPSTAPPPPLPGQAGSPLTSSGSALPPLPPPPPVTGAPASVSATTTPAEEARKNALLHRRKYRFRIWVEDGHVCIWASAAYARRAALIMAQQLNTTVDSNSVPEQRSWNYRGLLHADTTVPPPRHVNDVIIVAEDIPAMGLWQGDVLRCCTQEELRTMIRSKGTAPLPLPCTAEDTSAKGAVTAGTAEWQASSPYVAAAKLATAEPIGDAKSSSASSVTAVSNAAAAGSGGHVNYTSNHVSNPLLQERERAAPEAFWVRGAGGLDDSFTNITETNMPPHPKAEKQQLQAAMQRAKKAAAAAAAAQNSSKKRRSANTEAAVSAAAQRFVDIDRREGTLNIEEVVLAWMKVVAILTRDSTEEDRAWVRDPHGSPVRIDRYVIRRYEHDGVRFFIGVTPRFVGQQRRIEKVLGEVYALEEREGRRWRLPSQGRDKDDDEDDDGLHAGHNDDAYSEEAGHEPQFPLPLVSRRRESLSYASGSSAASSLKAPDSGAADMGSMFDDIWGTAVMPVSRSPPSNAPLTPPALFTVGPARQTSLTGSSNEFRRRSEAQESPENSTRLTFAVLFGSAASEAGKPAAMTAAKVRGAEQVGPDFEVDDLLERCAPDPLFFGNADDE
ncbi:hypothetical protein JIQ42_02729 [Leishmania sp. Namibia]|uniref:hypothetical protein n=1 Tax=Leishmania sp. Namibia TaxID=2802991 RepID=UPI001B54653F|nr:hypothetical protein JIQ42_02729 [Leishmania sp. Namibia]